MLFFCSGLSAADNRAATEVSFVLHRIGGYRGEACGVGDFNNDGKLDIVAGAYIYFAPSWEAVRIRTIKGEIDESGDGYTWDFMNAPLDVDSDGLLDVVSCSWHGKQLEWYRNIGVEEGEWPCHVIEKNGFYEHGELWDLDGDGLRREILPAVRTTVWYALKKGSGLENRFAKHVVSEKSLEWGVGAGDVNGDGRIDLLRPSAWFEAPADLVHGTWKEHSLAVGNIEEGTVEHTPQIIVYDVNADGLNDIVTSSAHRWGIFWYEQKKTSEGRTWKQHLIDRTWTQAHALTLADVDGDGDRDLVTGKRFRAHNGHDPEGDEPPGLYWYELSRGPEPVWTRHVISFGEGIGAGLNIPVVDIDNDGDLDIVVTGKWGGPVLFENRLR